MRRFSRLGLALALGGCASVVEAGPTTPSPAPVRECTAALRFEEPGETGADVEAPRTAVSLVLICEGAPTQRVALGNEVGACFAEPRPATLLAARCWWAGQGAVLIVREQEGALDVLRADVEEGVTTPEPTPLTSVSVPEGHVVHALR